MSQSNSAEPAFSARQARQLTKKFTAMLSDRTERGADRKVRRGSVDVEDRRAQVYRPIGDGTLSGALSWIDCLLKAVAEWDDLERRRGGARPLGLHGMRVLETLLGRRGGVAIDFRTGRLDPAIDTIARAAHVARATVIRALAQLKRLGILDWVRRTEKTGADGVFAPQRRQISNAYFLTPEGLPARVALRLRDLLAQRRLRSKGTGSPPNQLPPRRTPVNAELRAVLDRIENGLNRRATGEGASPPSAQCNRSGVEG